MGGSETTVACDDHYQVFRLLQPNYVMGGVGCKACAAGARYATFILSTYLFLTPRWVLRAPTVKLWGSQRAAKFAAMQTAPTFTLHFTLSGQVLTIYYTQNLKMAVKTDTCILGQKYSVLSTK